MVNMGCKIDREKCDIQTGAQDKTKPNVCKTMIALLVQRRFSPFSPISAKNRYGITTKTAPGIDGKIDFCTLIYAVGAILAVARLSQTRAGLKPAPTMIESVVGTGYCPVHVIATMLR